MASATTTPEEAAMMKAALMQTANDLERQGFGRGQIGAAMIGVGGALSAVYEGKAMALRVLDGTRDAILADESPTTARQ